MIALLLAATLLGFGERPAADLQLVPTAAYSQLASNGRGFVAVWRDLRNNEAFLFRASIDNAGKVVDSRPLMKSPNDSLQIASDGDRYLVAFSYSGRGVLLDEHGDVIRELALPQCRGLASNGSGYAIATDDSVQFLDREGQTIGRPVLLKERVGEFILGIAGSGSGYTLLTTDGRHVYVRTLSRAGTLSPPKDAGYFPMWWGDVGMTFDAAIASNGTEAVIAVLRDDGIYVIPFDGNDVRPARVIPRSERACDVAVLATGSGFVVVQRSSESTSLTHVAHDGAPASWPVTIEREPGAIAWNGWRLLFAGSTTARLYATSATFAAVGDAQAIAPYAVAQSRPRVATDGESALVMWKEPSGLRLSRIASDGSHADGAGIDVSDAIDAGGVAWNGNEWLVAYPAREGIRLCTMNRDGVLSSGTLFRSISAVTGVRVTSDGNGHFAVIWQAYNPQAVISVSLDGASPVDLTHFINGNPDVTWDSGAFRMVWMNYEFRGDLTPPLSYPKLAATGITFATMERDGFVSIDGIAQTNNDQQPRVARSFSMFVTDSVKVRRGAEEIALSAGVPASSAFAVDDDGHALLVFSGGKALLIGAGEPQPFTVAPDDAASPDVVWTRNGWMMVYTRIVDDGPYFHVPRVFVKMLDVTPARRRP